MPYLDLGPRRVEYEVVRGTSRRYIYFRIRPDLTLEVVLPRRRTVNVEKAIRERSLWLQQEYERMSMTRRVLSKDMVMLGGRLLKVVFQNGLQDSLSPDLDRSIVEVRTDDRRRLKELVRRWFLSESSVYAIHKVGELAPKVGAKPARVDVREIGKWGYCTKDRRLSFSWQLIALPERLREYVILHELIHLLEFNHSAAFRKKLGAVCPDFRDREKELAFVVPYDRLAPP